MLVPLFPVLSTTSANYGVELALRRAAPPYPQNSAVGPGRTEGSQKKQEASAPTFPRVAEADKHTANMESRRSSRKCASTMQNASDCTGLD